MIRKVVDGIYRGPQLIGREYGELVKLGVKTVVNLDNRGTEAFADMEECRNRLIQFNWQPMSELWPCSVASLKRIARVVQDCSHPVYVHCRRGIDRTGQVIAAWKILYLGWEVDAAYEEQVRLGHPTFYNLFGWKFILNQLKEI